MLKINKKVSFIVFLLFICSLSCSTKNKLNPELNKNPSDDESVKISRVFISDKKSSLKKKQTVQRDFVTITGVGDIMLGTNFPKEEYLPPDGGAFLLKGVEGYLKNSDITFGNLESSLLNKGKCMKACSDPERCYAFKMPEHYVNHLLKAGFNLLSIANNHIGDFGIKGREKTVEVLQDAGINFAGISTHPYTSFTKKGVKYGFCAFAPNVGTPDLRDIKNARLIVEKLNSISDIVIVSFHGGAEGKENRHVTGEEEFYYGENRGNVQEFARNMIEAGADIVFGHGPHVTRAVELYNERFIAYSLGNFCTYARFNLLGHNGIAPIVKVRVDKNGRFLNGEIIPLKQEYKKGPVLDEKHRAIFEIIELTSADFPDTNLIIQDNGTIIRKN